MTRRKQKGRSDLIATLEELLNQTAAHFDYLLTLHAALKGISHIVAKHNKVKRQSKRSKA